MIRTENEHQQAREQLKRNDEFIATTRASLEAEEFSPEEVERGLEPLVSFRAALEEEVAWYEGVRRRDFPPLSRLSDLGRLLIALRIANTLSQRELAKRLGMSEAQVSRDEKNGYHGITIERAQRVLDAPHERVTARVEEQQELLAA